jgi:hypothetical protein
MDQPTQELHIGIAKRSPTGHIPSYPRAEQVRADPNGEPVRRQNKVSR